MQTPQPPLFLGCHCCPHGGSRNLQRLKDETGFRGGFHLANVVLGSPMLAVLFSKYPRMQRAAYAPCAVDPRWGAGMHMSLW